MIELVKLPNLDINDLPTYASAGCSFASNSSYLAVGSSGGPPYLYIYKKVNNLFSRVLNINGAEDLTNARRCSFSADGRYLAIAHGSAPYISIFKRNGDEFTALNIPVGYIPNSIVHDCTLSPDGNYLVIVYQDHPYATVYKREGDTFSALGQSIGNLPCYTAHSCAFSPNSTYVAIGHDNPPYVTLFKRNGDHFSKLPDITGSEPGGAIKGCTFSSDNSYLAVTHNGYPFITIYKKDGDLFDRLNTVTGGAPPSTGNDCAFSNDMKYLAVSHYDHPYVTVYRRNEDVFIRQPSAMDKLPTGTALYCTFSNDDDYFAVSHGSDPCISIYRTNINNRKLTINTTPLDSIVEVKVDNKWVMGKMHILPPGTYEYKVSSEGYVTDTGTVIIANEDRVINITLELTKYQLVINPTPAHALVKLRIDGEWIEGKIYDVEPGTYTYEVSAEEYNTKTGFITITNENKVIPIVLTEIKYTLLINVIPETAMVEVKINNIWISGNEHVLKPGSYDYRVTAEGHIPKTGTVNIINQNETVNIDLGSTKYKLTMNTTPNNAMVEIEIDGEWTISKIHYLSPGTYNYRISMVGYYTEIGYVNITDKEESVNITLDEIIYRLTINTTPFDAMVEVQVDSEWIEGKIHELPLGTYEYRVSMLGFATRTGAVTILTGNETIYVDLQIAKYMLIINTRPTTATVEVKINNNWVYGSTHELESGTYEYRVFMPGYSPRLGLIDIIDGNVTITIHLEPAIYELIINPIPSDATVELKIDGQWIGGNIHILEPGMYECRVFKSGYMTRTEYINIVDRDEIYYISLYQLKYVLVINTSPYDAGVEVEIEGTWINGKIHNLSPGTYNYRVFKAGYGISNGSITIIDENKTIEVSLSEITYKLIINPNPIEATVEVKINDTWISGVEHDLLPGEYSYRVFMDGYDTKTDTVTMFSNDKTINVVLNKSIYEFTINPIPSEAIVEVKVGGIWVNGLTHNLTSGNYEYKVYLQDYETKTGIITIINKNTSIDVNLIATTYKLTVNTIPVNAIVELRIGDKWIGGREFNLEPGNYNYKISLNGYNTQLDWVNVVDMDKTISISLHKTEYTLNIVTIPAEATVSLVRTDSGAEWVGEKTYSLSPGEYEYTAKIGTYTKIDTFIMPSIDKTIYIDLEVNKLIISVLPLDSRVKINIDNSWIEGKEHWLRPGTYECIVSKDGYVTRTEYIIITDKTEYMNINLDIITYALTIITTPAEATSKIKPVGGSDWIEGKILNMPSGDYWYSMAIGGYTESDVFTMPDGNKTLSVTLNVYKFIINTEPYNAIVEVKIFGNWVEGKEHWLGSGTYEYRVTMIGYETKMGTIVIENVSKSIDINLVPIIYKLTIETDPVSILSEVKIDGLWEYGRTFDVKSGTYEYRLSAMGYETKTGTITIIDRNKSVSIVLDKAKYILTLIPTPPNALVEVEIDGNWIWGEIHELECGDYRYRVVKEGYKTVRDTIYMFNGNITRSIQLERKKRSGTVLINNAPVTLIVDFGDD